VADLGLLAYLKFVVRFSSDNQVCVGDPGLGGLFDFVDVHAASEVKRRYFSVHNQVM
jgi:hypothetical protein